MYVKQEYRGKGIGTKLMETIILEGRQKGIHTVIARISEGNEVSVHLHKSFNFKHIGTMKEVGIKFGKIYDVLLMQLMLKKN